MDNIYKIATALVVFTITSILTYLFRMRQLYLVAPTLFEKTSVSANGSVCQIFIYNRGKQVEEELVVAIDPGLQIELLASDYAGLSLSEGTVRIDRLHKGKSASALLLVENGTFDSSKITSFTSKATVGNVIKKVADVPPNGANLFLGAVGLIAFIPAMYGSYLIYDHVHTTYLGYRLKAAYESGWRNLDSYFDSELRKSYGDQEFPISLVKSGPGSDTKTLVFEVYNKAAVPLQVTADKNNKVGTGLSDFASVKVPPMSHHQLVTTVPAPDEKSHRPEIAFTFKSGDEFIYQFYFEVGSQQSSAE